MHARTRSLPLPLLILGAIILARLAVAAWWLIADEGVVDVESGRHLQFAWDALGAMRSGEPLVLLEADTIYPPLHHLLGVAGAAVAGLDVESFIGAQALLAIPALAIGCYGAASLAYGPLAGVLAAAFALGAPMAVSAMHMYLIDTTQLATVAVAVWAILASQRFSRTGVAALAGAAVGFGMLAKQNFPLFVAGLIVVVLARGGWRHWRGLLAFAGVALLISATWYWAEVDRTFDLVRGASAPSEPTEAAGAATPARWSTKNFGYYVWSTVNISVLLPLTLMTVGGTIALLVRWARTRRGDDLTPELVAGGLFAYLALTWIALKDPRYALPALPYMAILGTGWIPLLRPRWRAAAVAFLSAVVVLNVAGTVADSGPPVRPAILPDAPEAGLYERQVTLYAPGGWIAGRPETEGAALKVMKAAKADGVERVAVDPGASQAHFNSAGLDILSRVVGLPLVFAFDRAAGEHVVIASDHARVPYPPGRCATTSDGFGIYLSRGPIDIPFEQREFYCPPGVTSDS